MNQGFHTEAEQIAEQNIKNIKDRQFVITGSTAGLGKESVRVLLKYGGIVTCACRNIELMKNIFEEFKTEIPNLQNCDVENNNRFQIIPCELSDLKSVNEFATQQIAKVGKLDVLINNAGIMACPLSQTKDGHEMQFGTNHLGHYLLTGRLLDLLLQSKDARVVTVSSITHGFAWYPHFDFDDIKSSKRTYNEWHRYGVSKLANVQFAKGLADRYGPKLKSQSLHPGVIDTELKRHNPPTMPQWSLITKGMLCKFIAMPKDQTNKKNIPQGTSTQIYAAVSDKVLSDNNGSQLSNCQEFELLHQIKPDLLEKLFDQSAKETGQTFKSSE